MPIQNLIEHPVGSAKTREAQIENSEADIDPIAYGIGVP
jgi:hypothetical protein